MVSRPKDTLQGVFDCASKFCYRRAEPVFVPLMKAMDPPHESQRLAALEAFRILDTAPEEAFDDLVSIATAICGRPMGAVTLVDQKRQWLKARTGIDAEKTSREDAFCAHAILDPSRVMVVEDTHLDPRFQNNPLVKEAPWLRFYAGAPLVTSDGYALGSLCVMDQQPGRLSDQQTLALKALARQVVYLLELRRVSNDLEDMVQEQAWYEERLQQENASLMSQTRTDPLTGLGNRRALQEAQEEVKASGQSAWVALIDIDHFKVINDNHGHEKGDEVLAELGEVLQSNSWDHHTVARLGGEEFVWLMPGASEEEAREGAETLRVRVENHSFSLPCTISIGLAHWIGEGDSEAAWRRADEALYEAKRNGRNCVAVLKR